MLYHYRAADQTGTLVEGDVDAPTLQEALRLLSQKDLRPISLKPIKTQQAGTLGGWFGGKITIADKVFLTKYLALMLRVGTDLLSAINILIADSDKPVMKNFLLEVRENLTRGEPFYQAFAKHPKIFPTTFVSLIKAAEDSGNLQKTFEDLNVSLASEADLRNKIRAAFIYPIVLLCMASAIMIFLVTFALPKVAGVFTESGVTPPLFSRIVFTVGLFAGQNIFPILIVVAVLIVGITIFVKKTETGKRAVDVFLTHTPGIKNIYRDLSIQRMASTMSSLMKAGLPIVQTITIAADTVPIREFRYALLRIANEGLSKGLTIGEAFRRETVLPQSVTSLIAISEKAGHIDEVLSTLGDFYASNVESSIKTAVALIEPAMLLLMGVMVGVIALSIIVPIYQMTAAV
ncbi:MAG: type II secretion system F family protein [Minisyncoccia bacterium]|jgi:type II secretory pathway component PulF